MEFLFPLTGALDDFDKPPPCVPEGASAAATAGIGAETARAGNQNEVCLNKEDEMGLGINIKEKCEKEIQKKRVEKIKHYQP